MDITFHFPPELLRLLGDTIPRLCRSRADVLTFFRGAGVSSRFLAPYYSLLQTSKGVFNKYRVTTELLIQLNSLGDAAIRERREIVRRVVEFEDFSVCWENDRLIAAGLVAQIRDMVNRKDSFTRMRMEKDEERRKWVEYQEAESAVLRKHQENINAVKLALFTLFSESNAHKRGKALEKVLNDLFTCYGIGVREAFTVKGTCGEGTVEQIDGLVELDGHIYLTEMKWWNPPIGVGEISPHLVKLFNRGGQARGIFISYSEFTQPAIAQCRDALASGALIILVTLQEIVELLNNERSLKSLLKQKIQACIAQREPYFKVE